MRSDLLFIAVSGFSLMGLSSCATRSQPTARPERVSNAGNSTSAALFQDVNAYRARMGKPALIRHEGLDRLAQGHSDFLKRNRGKFKLSKTGNVSHDGFESRALIARQKFDMPGLRENVAAGPRGTSITSNWAGSKAHRPSLLGDSTHTGVGVAVDSDGMIFATQLYGSPATSHLMLRQRFGTF